MMTVSSMIKKLSVVILLTNALYLGAASSGDEGDKLSLLVNASGAEACSYPVSRDRDMCLTIMRRSFPGGFSNITQDQWQQCENTSTRQRYVRYFFASSWLFIGSSNRLTGAS
jgi:hypothetical protein